MRAVPTTVDFPEALPAERERDAWSVVADGRRLRLSNLDKVYWPDDGYTKADLVAYYWNAAAWVLPYVRDRPLTMRRMPDGLAGEPFYAKQAPDHTPDWVTTAAVTSRDDGKTIDYVLGQDRAALVWLANLGCIELHPWHSRVDAIGRPDYAFFDLDPFDVGFETVRDVALVVKAALDHLGLRGYPRTSGATGMQVYVPLDRVHSHAAVRAFVRQVCRSVHDADRGRTTLAPRVADRSGRVYLDYGMNTEGRNIAATYCLRPEPGAPVATPLSWDEVDEDVEPRDFTLRSIWTRLERVGDLFAPVLEGGQDLRTAMRALGIDPEGSERPASHDVGRVAPRGAAEAGGEPSSAPAERLGAYAAKRDFGRTPEPPASTIGGSGNRFVVQQHLARRLHHDVRLERDGVAVSWAVPKGLPDVLGPRRLAVQTEDHPLEYLDFEGDIPEGEYGAGPVRIWDRGTYELIEWTEGKVTVRLHGERHRGHYHLVRTDGNQWLAMRRDDPEPGELPADPPRYRPMLASSDPVALDDPVWCYEVKWDGVRVLATVQRPGVRDDGETTLVSRLGNDVSAAYPELAGLWERTIARNAVLDGEIIAPDEHGRPSFQRLQRRMHLRERASVEQARRRIPIQLIVFDVLFADGEPLVDLPLTDRLARLDDLLVPGGPIQRSAFWVGDGEALYDAVVERGLEGLVAKRAASRYQPGRRSRDWRKVKVRRTADVVVGGWLAGEGGRAGRLGALLVGAHDTEGALRYLGRVGTGFDDPTLERLEALLTERASDAVPFADAPRLPSPRWVTPDLVVRVEYAQLTDECRLRAPAYKGQRDDVEPRECRVDDVC